MVLVCVSELVLLGLAVTFLAVFLVSWFKTHQKDPTGPISTDNCLCFTGSFKGSRQSSTPRPVGPFSTFSLQIPFDLLPISSSFDLKMMAIIGTTEWHAPMQPSKSASTWTNSAPRPGTVGFFPGEFVEMISQVVVSSGARAIDDDDDARLGLAGRSERLQRTRIPRRMTVISRSLLGMWWL